MVVIDKTLSGTRLLLRKISIGLLVVIGFFLVFFTASKNSKMSGVLGTDEAHADIVSSGGSSSSAPSSASSETSSATSSESSASSAGSGDSGGSDSGGSDSGGSASST